MPISKQVFVMIGLLVWAAAATVVAKPEAPAIDPEVGARLDDARATAQLLAAKLRVALKETLAAKGAAQAISACSEMAPNLAQQIALEKGARVTRVSLKPRNPLLGTPDAWEQKALLDFEARKKQGEDISKMEVVAVVDEPQGRFFRYIKAVPTEGACINCHGPSQGLAPDVKQFLKQRYPHDLATGFNVGDIRGGISIKERLF